MDIWETLVFFELTRHGGMSINHAQLRNFRHQSLKETFRAQGPWIIVNNKINALESVGLKQYSTSLAT